MIDLSHIKPVPGVYIFKDAHGHILYVGKAVNLVRRVKQYLQKENTLSPKTVLLISQMYSVSTIETTSEFDALLLEAKLIGQYKPKYNSIAKDDKSPLYVCLTLSEALPRVLYLRGKQLGATKIHKQDRVFGPFQSSRVARQLMHDLRRSVPYCTQKRRNGSACFYTHLGLCSPCPSSIAKLPQNKTLTHQYRQNIFRLKDILSGNAPVVMKKMEREMNQLANRNAFEQAEIKKQQIQALYQLFSRHYDVSFYTDRPDAMILMGKRQLDALAQILDIPIPHRIECVDISNTGGALATGSLVVAQDGILDTSAYRRFRIRTLTSPNDVGMIEEVVLRRFTHSEWPKPDLLIIDGGKPQLSRALAVLWRMNIGVSVISLAKRREEIYTQKGRILLSLTNPALHLVQRLRDEAHRFALSYHRKLRNTRAFVTINRT